MEKLQETTPVSLESTFLVKGATVVLDQKTEEKTDILVKQGVISDIGNISDKNIQTIDASNYLVLPGLINSHTHCAMSFLKDRAHHIPNMIENFFFKMESQLTADFCRIFSQAYILSGLQSGVTTFYDHYYHIEGVIESLKRFGVRGLVGEVIADKAGAFPSYDKWKHIKKSLESWDSSGGIYPILCPHAPNSVSEKLAKEISDFSKINKVKIHYHLSQTQNEFDSILKEYSKTPIQWANDMGWLSPNSLAVHVLHLGTGDLNRLIDSGVTIVNCPASQMIYEKLAPIDQFWKANIPLAVATDCSASNDQADILSEIKLFALLLKDRGISQTDDLYNNILKSITEVPAKFYPEPIGKIAKNFRADLLFVEKDLSISPVFDLPTTALFSLNSRKIDHIMIDGKWRLWNGKSPLVDEQKLRGEFEDALTKIQWT